jgi:acetylglutamate kinase
LTTLIKVSGSDLDDPVFSRRLAGALAADARDGHAPVLVHGGGKEITTLLNAMNIESRFSPGGLRITDAPTRDVALMVLAGLANKRMVAHLLNAGVDAVGLSGVDGGLIRVAKMDASLGFVGKPVRVNAELLTELLNRELIPVINPMSIGDDGEIYNVNADHAAGAIAAALNVQMLTFVTNVPGVLDAGKTLIPTLTAAQTEQLIADGVISGGMIPKVRTCLEALTAGARAVRITNLDGLRAGGTVFH